MLSLSKLDTLVPPGRTQWFPSQHLIHTPPYEVREGTQFFETYCKYHMEV